jgi:AraC-like DNA-binding protein
MILTEMPDLPPRPDNAQNTAFRRDFCSRWGIENAAILGRSRYTQYVKLPYPLSVKTAQCGSTEYVVNHRRLSVDDDTYLVLNGRQSYEATFTGEPVISAFCVYMRPELVAEVSGGVYVSWDAAADAGEDVPHLTPEFSENLRLHDHLVTPQMRHMRDCIVQGERSEVWLEEQLTLLLARLLAAERIRDATAAGLVAAKPSTRMELLRRVGWATDFIHSSYAQTISLDDLAQAAHLSKFHLVRLFKQATGETPHAYLQRKRASVARRLLEATHLPINEVVQLTGFNNRSTLFRQLRKHYGGGGSKLRGDMSDSLTQQLQQRKEELGAVTVAASDLH